MALTKQQIDQLGLDLIYQPGGGGYSEGYFAGEKGVQHILDTGTADYLKGLGSTFRTINAAQGAGYSTTGGDTVNMGYLNK